MSAALNKMDKDYPLDSLSYIFLSTESIFDTGIKISAELSKLNGIYKRYVEVAIGHTSFEKDMNKVLKPYNLYGAQNEAYMCRSAENGVSGLYFNELGVNG